MKCLSYRIEYAIKPWSRGFRATGYGANIGPNPVQQPYINEDELRAKAVKKKSQMDYQYALMETSKLKNPDLFFMEH